MIHPRRVLCPPLLFWLIVPSLSLFLFFHRQTYVTQTHPVTPSSTPVLKEQQHVFRSDGLLQVNPNAPHPIYHLISNAEQQWETKLHKASRTLSHAVAEYERRYHRKPPAGFDAWWSYVRANNIQLPDEYDQIHRDLESFWGMHPKDLRAIQAEWEAHEDSYTIGKDYDYDPIDVLNFTLGGDAPEEKAHLLNVALEFTELLEDVQDAIPPFRAVFSPHDRPNLLTDWELKEMALQAATKHEFIDINNPPKVKLDGWLSACPPNSPARTTYSPSSPPLSNTSPPKTFIHNHRLAMDPCTHPSLLTSHGQFLSYNNNQRPIIPHRKLIPQFSYSPSMLHYDIVTPTLLNWVQDLPASPLDNPPWNERLDERLLWRGQTTGIWHEGSGGSAGDRNGGTAWWLSHRDRLVAYTNPQPYPDAGGEGELQEEKEDVTVQILTGGIRQENHNRPWYDDDPWRYPPTHLTPTTPHTKTRLFPLLFDVSFTDPPVSCEVSTCEYLKQHSVYEFLTPTTSTGDQQHQDEGGKYRFVMDVDGNAWSSKFKQLITSHALVFKASVYPEWWLDRIQPWVHYIPIQNGYEDLVDVLLFFQSRNFTSSGTGTGTGTGGGDEGNGKGKENEELGEKIAEAGRDWSIKFWRKEDVTAYLFRLLLEYARVMSLDRESMGFEYEAEVL